MEKEPEQKRGIAKMLRSFAKWVLLPVLVLSASIFVVTIAWDYYREFRDRDLAIAKTWPSVNIPFNQGKALVKTSWRGGLIYFQFTISPISEAILRQYERRYSTGERAFFFDLEDSSGFKLGRIDIDLNKMNRLVNEKSKFNTLELKDSTYYDRDAYKNASRLRVLWSGGWDEITKDIETAKPSRPTSSTKEKDKKNTPTDAEPAKLRAEVIEKMKESRDSMVNLLAIYEENLKKLRAEYEERRELYRQGKITKTELNEIERALTIKKTEVEQVRRWVQEEDEVLRLRQGRK